MYTIKVLGTGCKSCDKTMGLIKEYVEKHQLDYEVIKVSDLPEIMRYKVMSTPGVVVNERVVHTGSVPDEDQLEEWLK